ncbi:hypothetical protein D3C85_1876450 [compost metagenome]
MMKYTPRVRSASAPVTAAYAAAASRAAGSSHHRLAASDSGDSKAATYAPMPKKAACPRLTIPAPPTSNCRLSAKIA